MAWNVHSLRNLSLFLNSFQIFFWSLQDSFLCTAYFFLLSCTKEICNDSNMQWIPSFCHASFHFSQPLNYILPSFQVHWNQIWLWISETTLCSVLVLWFDTLEGLKQGLCWARSVSSTWAQHFMTTNRIIKGHANSGKALPCIPGSRIEKKLKLVPH